MPIMALPGQPGQWTSPTTGDRVSLRQVIYTSHALVPFEPADLADLLIRARANNEAHGLTGMLVHADGDFLQVIEGESLEVETVLERIRRDTRHTKLRVVADRTIHHRSFPDWRMAFRDSSADELEGFDPFFVEGGRLVDVEHGVAARMIEAFATFHP